MGHDVFVSYSTKDKTITDTIVASMEQNQIRCWYAPRDIKPSEDWGKAISNAVEQSKVFLLIFSGNSNRSQRVLDELNLAISQEITILPFRIENLEPDGAMRLHLSSRHWLDAYDPSWESHIKKLINTVSSSLETTISEEEIKVPETLERKQKTLKNKGIRRILVGIATAALVVSAGWYGLTRLNKNDDETQKLNLSLTEQAVATLNEKEEVQETATPATEDPPSVTQTFAAAMAEQEEATQEATSELCQIVFLSTRSGDPNLWLMEPDGSNQTQLSFNQYGDIYSNWSPDGTQLTFNSSRDGDTEIFIMNADGTNIRQLTTNDFFDDKAPAWSPDGEKIAFYSNRDGDYEAYTMDPDGSNIQQLTTDHGMYGDYEFMLPLLGWSPDGEQIVFASDRDGDLEIFIMDADGSNIHQLTSNEDIDQFPDWSPDGKQIIFDSDRYGDEEIFVMNTDGTNLRQLTSNNGTSIYPEWSPDGSQIAFSSDRDGDFEIWIMDADGSNQQQLTFNEVKEFLPAWSPLCK
jgi:Tol biopolymer transport system component